MNKAAFLKNEFIPLLQTISPNTTPKWGKMNLQQAIEHMADSVRMANGKDKQPLLTAPEKVSAMQDFIRSETLFKENTQNRLMSSEPVPVRHSGIHEAIAELESELDDFFTVFKNTPDLKVMNPFFGALDYELSVMLLYKHAVHHLHQFGAVFL